MSIKEQAKQVIQRLRDATKDQPDAGKVINETDRMLNDLRHQLSTATEKAAHAEAALTTVRDRAITVESQLDQLRGEIESLKQQLATAKNQRVPLDLQTAIEEMTVGRALSGAGMGERRKQLVRLVERYLPQFVQNLRACPESVIFHQDAFAAGYDASEYALLGMWIKYIGLKGQDTLIRITGRNGSTFKEPE